MAALAVSACGSTGQTSTTKPAAKPAVAPSAAAAKCLKNALYAQALQQSQAGCADAKAAKYESGLHKIVTSCTRKIGNEFICQAQDTDLIGTSGTTTTFYDVTYDGQSLVYRQSGPASNSGNSGSTGSTGSGSTGGTGNTGIGSTGGTGG